ncbi:MAG: lipopolysaccharide transport periplasmic protein LptA [Alphaproteobacteria bacterium]
MRIVFILLLFPLLAHAADKAPLDITANQLEVNFTNKLATFSGAVQAVRGEMTLHADTLTLTQTANNDVKEVKAIGHVTLIRADQTATGNTATYTPATQLLELQGNVTLTRGGNTMAGDHLRYDMAKGTMKLTNTSGTRVKAVVEAETLEK